MDNIVILNEILQWAAIFFLYIACIQSENNIINTMKEINKKQKEENLKKSS